jgi:exopolyphosphatase/guanosine-5'-triphosphate,3'-diphosphate pyrophosphatase
MGQDINTKAVIDLGSNALRASIYRKIGNSIHTIYSIRDPLRLGEDVFKFGNIKPKKITQLEETFIKLLHLFSEYGVTEVKACATSAMREARNRKEIVAKLFKYTGIELEVISGDKEARLVLNAVERIFNLTNKAVVIIDLGGGSTEITIIKKNGNIHVRSFPVGTVRLLEHTNLEFLEQRIRGDVSEMSTWVKKHLQLKKIDLVIGTGGNLRRFGKIRKKIMRKNDHECDTREIEHMAQVLNSMSFMDRIRKLEMDTHRADVILPASLLVSKLLKNIKCEKILLPKVGLKEGIALEMFDDENLTFYRR